ncbi:hypothetical protein LINGRAHAP2_LOCUS34745 [Linum grandiflorum]
MGKVEEKLKLIITTTPDSTLIAIFTLFTVALFAVILIILNILIIRRRKSNNGSRSGRLQQISEHGMLMDMEYGWSTTEDDDDDDDDAKLDSSRWVTTIRKVLMSSMRWSEGSRWTEEEELIISSRSIISCCSSSNNSFCSLTCSSSTRAAVKPPEIRISAPTIDNRKSRSGGGILDDEWRNKRQGMRMSTSQPVWQRPILMGEKCELPKHSGLILYDERGRPLHHDHHQIPENNRRKGRTTLKDLM